jgi:hypothetical protein
MESWWALVVDLCPPGLYGHRDRFRRYKAFLDSVKVKVHRVERWAQVASAFSPNDPASIVFIPAEVASTKDHNVAYT